MAEKAKKFRKELQRLLQKDESPDEERKKAFVKSLLDVIKIPEVREVLERTSGEISLFAHYQSSVGAAMTNSPPSYELALTKRGLVVRSDGRINEEITFESSLEEWETRIPYGGLFHDSSSGDYTFNPNPSKYISEIKNKILRLSSRVGVRK